MLLTIIFFILFSQIVASIMLKSRRKEKRSTRLVYMIKLLSKKKSHLRTFFMGRFIFSVPYMNLMNPGLALSIYYALHSVDPNLTMLGYQTSHQYSIKSNFFDFEITWCCPRCCCRFFLPIIHFL